MTTFLVEWPVDGVERYRIEKTACFLMASEGISRAAARRILDSLEKGQSHRARTFKITRL